jgi:amidophosphoribosyltransferase
VKHLHDCGIKEVHIRIACPPLVHACEFLNFSRSKSIYDLATRRVIKQMEGSETVDVKKYSDSGTQNYAVMVDNIRKNLNLTSLKYQKLPDLVKAIGLPKEKICTHCWDGSSYF